MQLANLEPELKSVIFGQDEAIEELVSAIKLSRSGLRSPEKPIGSFLFAAPPASARPSWPSSWPGCSGVEFLRFDMSEYSEKHTVSRLIGAPPGYVGFDQGGLLTDAVRKHPYSVVVLDEIEKAHPELFNILLQVMDHATLTDNNGRKADFRNVVLILTTNAGAREMSAQGHRLRRHGGCRRRHAAGEGGHRAHVHARVPQPARRLGAVLRPRARGHPQGRRQGGRPAPDAARRTRRSRSS